jgi:hypothetical protein
VADKEEASVVLASSSWWRMVATRKTGYLD